MHVSHRSWKQEQKALLDALPVKEFHGIKVLCHGTSFIASESSVLQRFSFDQQSTFYWHTGGRVDKSKRARDGHSWKQDGNAKMSVKCELGYLCHDHIFEGLLGGLPYAVSVRAQNLEANEPEWLKPC